jgi:hypothetical protein
VKFIQKHKRPQIAKAILNKKFNARDITIPNIKLCYRAITIKAACYWQVGKPMDQKRRCRHKAMPTGL